MSITATISLLEFLEGWADRVRDVIFQGPDPQTVNGQFMADFRSVMMKLVATATLANTKMN